MTPVRLQRYRGAELEERDLRLLEDLDADCFPREDPYPKRGRDLMWWVAWRDRQPVGFAGARWWRPDRCLFLCRAGVLPRARGKGLHRRLVRARIRLARTMRARAAYTYTLTHNLSSANNLIRCGFTLWEPEWAWAGREGVLYWWRDV